MLLGEREQQRCLALPLLNTSSIWVAVLSTTELNPWIMRWTPIRYWQS